MTTNNSIIIFHRSKHNSEEDLINQKTFMEANQARFGSVKVIDYMTNDYLEANKVFEVFKNTDLSKKVTVIMNSFLSRKDYDLQYNLHFYFRAFKLLGVVSMYLMDSE